MVDITIIVPIAGLAALSTAAYLTMLVLRLPRGDERMRKIEGAIQDGARAFMRRQYRTIAVIARKDVALAVELARSLDTLVPIAEFVVELGKR